jgi:hypothetical protein
MYNLININNITTTFQPVLESFASFVKSFNGNITGMKISLSLKDNTGTWYTMSQRIFTNGSIHTSHIKSH